MQLRVHFLSAVLESAALNLAWSCSSPSSPGSHCRAQDSPECLQGDLLLLTGVCLANVVPINFTWDTLSCYKWGVPNPSGALLGSFCRAAQWFGDGGVLLERCKLSNIWIGDILLLRKLPFCPFICSMDAVILGEIWQKSRALFLKAVPGKYCMDSNRMKLQRQQQNFCRDRVISLSSRSIFWSGLFSVLGTAKSWGIQEAFPLPMVGKETGKE